MNTEAQVVTEEFHFFDTKEDHIKFREEFKRLAKCKSIHEPYVFLLRNTVLLKAFDNGFTPIQSEVKISNGQKPYQALEDAFYSLIHLTRTKQSDKLLGLSEDYMKRVLAILVEYSTSFIAE